jgi:hypothetical protein
VKAGMMPAFLFAVQDRDRTVYIRNMSRRIQFAYVDLGRGHPFYQDGILEALVRRGKIGLVRTEFDVIASSRGLGRLAWQGAGWMYRLGGSSPLIMPLYQRLRSQNDYNHPSMMLRIMGRDLLAAARTHDDPILVAHPTLVGILAGRPDLLYQHGEHAVPPEALVAGASVLFVPTDEAAQPFVQAGYSQTSVIVTGLCVEPALVKQSADAFAQRMARIEGREPLTGVFFSSGAEPRLHVEKIAVAARSVAYEGGRGIVFARRDGRLARSVRRGFQKSGLDLLTVDASTLMPTELPPGTLVEYESRRELDLLTARFFPQFDFVVAPSHERTNWGLGLGLPMFVTAPAIGTFAPLNEALLLRCGVARRLSDYNAAHALGGQVTGRLRRAGTLAAMAQAGWGKLPIGGFGEIADYLNRTYAEPATAP